VVGRGFPGNFSGTVPITFIQSLYCVTASNREMTGLTARLNGCPGSAARFRAQHPALFHASGFAAHPYAQGTPPTVPTYQCGINHFCFNTRTKRSSPGYADFAVLPRLERLLRRLTGHQLPIWNTEYGYWTNPPDRAHGALPIPQAAYYLNWAEYLSYRTAWLRSYDQYLLRDPSSGEFADGLELPDGTPKATFYAFQMPLYMPVTRLSHAGNLLVWGGARAAVYALSLPGLRPRVQIQFQPGGRGAYRTIGTVTISNPRGYFQTREPFTQTGNVRLAYTRLGGQTLYSRTQAVVVR
jgi:hypothetical protein